MKFGSLESGDDDEHTGALFVKIPEIFVTQNAIFFGMEPSDKVFDRKTSITLKIYKD